VGKALNAGNKNQASRNKIKAGRNQIKARTQRFPSLAQQKQNIHSLGFIGRNRYFSDGYVEVTPVSPLAAGASLGREVNPVARAARPIRRVEIDIARTSEFRKENAEFFC
jgi:hypothetical protein